MAPDVQSVRPLNGTLVKLRFADGLCRHVDIAELVRPEGVFVELHAPGFIASARVNPDSGTIQWPSGGDLSPEVLYAAGRRIDHDELAA